MAVVMPAGRQHNVVMPAGRLFTIDDLDRFPDDGNRYELIEGSLHLTPPPLLAQGLVHSPARRRGALPLDPVL